MKTKTALLWLALGLAALFLARRLFSTPTTAKKPTTGTTSSAGPVQTIYKTFERILPVQTTQDLGNVIASGTKAFGTLSDTISGWFKPSSATAAPSSVATDSANIENDFFYKNWSEEFQEEAAWDNSKLWNSPNLV